MFVDAKQMQCQGKTVKYFDDDDTSSIYNNNGCNCKNVFFFHGNLAYRGCDVEMSGIFYLLFFS